MPRGGDEERGQMPRPRDHCVPTLLNQPVNKLIFCPHTRRLVCGEFRQVCDKIRACRVMGTVGIDWCITVYYKSPKNQEKPLGPG